MQIDKLSEMTGGWFIGNFKPAVIQSTDFEVCVKTYLAGQVEAAHYQRVATEVTVIICGEARMGSEMIQTGDIVTIYPNEVADFEAITDVSLVAVKFPSSPSDKVLANE